MAASTHNTATASRLLMIRPVNFGFNPETAVNNFFQTAGEPDAVQQKALAEFDHFVQTLKAHQIEVTVFNDTPTPYTPDSLFPNNWVSFHEGGVMCLYPMFAVNRRQERKPALLAALQKEFNITSTIDFTHYEKNDQFLEGTGSMVLDRNAKIAYACLSPRTDKQVLSAFCREMNYTAVIFEAVDSKNNPIYHTNVMMGLADRYVVICAESIRDAEQREQVITSITGSGKRVIPITPDQMHHFAGNVLQVTNQEGETFLLMSSQAKRSLTPEQIVLLESFNPILDTPLDTIETSGGGSARCMIAEVYV